MEGSEYAGIELELYSEKGLDLLSVESLVEAVLVKTYGTIGETQLKYEVKDLGGKKEGEVYKKSAFLKVHRKDKSKIWSALAWYGGNELQRQKFVLIDSEYHGG